MSNDRYYDELLTYITEHGETGVNVLAKELNVPLSTMQRYLERQSYFRKTVNRKWDTPDNVDTDIKTNTMTLMVNSVETTLLLLSSQLDELRSNVQNALLPVNTLKRAVDRIITPVAGKSNKSVNIDERLIKIANDSYELHEVFKKQKANIPEEYRDLLFNLDYVGLMLEMGIAYATEMLSADVYALLMGQTDTLSDDTLKMLEEYQKGA